MITNATRAAHGKRRRRPDGDTPRRRTPCDLGFLENIAHATNGMDQGPLCRSPSTLLRKR